MKQEEKRIKKRVGLITFHASHNNGSMLQAIALKNMLKKYGCEVEIIDFSNEGQRNLYAPLPKAHNWKQVIKRAIWRTNYKELLKKSEEKTLYLTNRVRNYLELHQLTEQANYDDIKKISDRLCCSTDFVNDIYHESVDYKNFERQKIKQLRLKERKMEFN